MLVVDASFTVVACTSASGFSVLADERLLAPPLMWSEARSALRLTLWRGQLTDSEAERAHEALLAAPVERRDPPELGGEAWAVAREMGWARTYDAEYVALARLVGCRLITDDHRLRRGADRLGLVILPEEL